MKNECNIERCLKEVGYVLAPISGTSMLPLLKQGKSLVWLTTIGEKRLEKGDVVLYKKNDGTLVLHRIIGKEKDTYLLLGDHRYNNPEYVKGQEIIAVAEKFWVNGKFIKRTALWYRIYLKIWTGNLKLRRILLAVLRFFNR